MHYSFNPNSFSKNKNGSSKALNNLDDASSNGEYPKKSLKYFNRKS